MRLKLCIVIIIFYFLFSFINSSTCGGNVECNCGDTLISSYLLKENLICDNNGLSLNSKVTLNCDNYKIQSSGSGFGVSINGVDNSKILNCQILNFTNGIEQKSVQIPNLRLDPNVNEINNNVIENNNVGIVNINAERMLIRNNTFKNNSLFAMTVSSESFGSIYSNVFYKNNISYSNTKGKVFCVNSEDNTYLNGAIGPTCNCEIPNPNILYDSKVNFCNGDYKMSLNLGPNANINCNGASFTGTGTGYGFILQYAPNTIISNCIIRGFGTGIVYTHKGTKTQSSENGKLFNSTIYNVEVGLSFNYQSFAKILDNNSIDARVYAISNNLVSNYVISAKNNYWGTNNKTDIENKFYKPELISFEPYIKVDKSDFSDFSEFYLEEKEISIINNELSFNIYNNIVNNNHNHFPNFPVYNFSYKLLIYRSSVLLSEKELNVDLINSETEINHNFNFENFDKVVIILDSRTNFKEINENNNVYSKIYEKNFNFYLDKIESSDLLRGIYKNYIYEQFGDENFNLNKENSQIIINILKEKNTYSSFNFPYGGSLESKIVNEKINVYISGYDVSGQIFALKYFILNSNLFLNNEYKYIINKSNIDAIKVYDFLQLDENIIYYKTQTNNFGDIVYDALNDNFIDFNEEFIPIYYDDENNEAINYRLWNYESKFSNKFKEVIVNNEYPIVLGGGLWSNIKSFEEFAKELGREGFDVYLIELTGGENSECDSCYNYPYEFLTDEVYPSYINHILNKTNSEKVKYVGHSNGARTAIDSLSKEMLDSNKIDSLVAIGVPGAFEGGSELKFLISRYGNKIKIEDKPHLSIVDLITFGNLDLDFNQNKISNNLWLEYYDWIVSINDSQPGEKLNVDNFLIIGGKKTKISDDDLIVTLKDIDSIYENIKINNNKYFFIVNSKHTGMTENNKIKNLVSKFIKGENYNLLDNLNLEKNEIR